jgi:uncharacterized protein (TIGR02246 family)
MKFILISSISIVLTASVLGQSGNGTENTKVSDQIVQKMLTAFVDAWNAHDASSFSMVFAEDADFTNVRGMSAHGRDAIRNFHQQPFASWFKESHLKITENKIRYLKPDLAAVDTWWEMTGAKAPDGTLVPLRKGLASLLVSAKGDQCLIMVMHNMDLPLTP